MYNGKVIPSEGASSLKQVRHLDNSRLWMPVGTSLLLILLFVIFIWFFRGGSFRLYASAFFSFYFLTRQIWLSVLLIGITQNIIFLPLRILGLRFSTSISQFEEELEKDPGGKKQYFLFTQKVRKGDWAIIFFIFSFVVNAIAFFSAGRIFLIDFYSQPIKSQYLYSAAPYPSYPLLGTDFYFPFFTVDSTYALPWKYILLIWLSVTLLFAIPRFLWRIVKPILWRNRQVLQARINYNRLFLATSGFSLTFLIASTFILRHIPTSLSFTWLVADLTRPNRTMNAITAIATFITTIHAGFTRHRLTSAKALASGISADIVNKVFKDNMKGSFQNGLILGIGAYLVTNQIPCAFELSVATFEFLYIISPYTFDRFLRPTPKSPIAPAAAETPAPAPTTSV